MGGWGDAVSVETGSSSVSWFSYSLVCGQEMWEGHLVGLEILRLFYNRSTALLRKTYLSVSHPCSATLTSLSVAYWTSHSLNKVVVLPVGLVFLSVDTSFSSHEICPLLFFWCRQICGAWDKLSWKTVSLKLNVLPQRPEQSTGHSWQAVMAHVIFTCPAVFLLPVRNTEMGSDANSCPCPFFPHVSLIKMLQMS